MANTRATMITMTTYGTWLRGDKRGWVDDGKILPAAPFLEDADRQRMEHAPFQFRRDQLHDVGKFIGQSLVDRMDIQLFALAIGTWHVHFVIGPTSHPIGDVVKCAKDAVRYGLRPGRPIWTAAYDKRFCFDDQAAHARVRYVERHNEAIELPAAPWPFLTQFHCPYLAPGH